MNQLPELDSNSQYQGDSLRPDSKSSSLEGDSNRAIQGNNNRAVQGDGNQVVQIFLNQQEASLSNSVQSKNEQNLIEELSWQEEFTQTLKNQVFEEHKYKGELACVELHLLGRSVATNNKNLLLQLSITFGEVVEIFPYNSRLLGASKQVNVRFGIQRVKLHLEIIEGTMPIMNRNHKKNLGEWKVTTSGDKNNPVWQIEAQENQQILKGSYQQQMLGIIDLLEERCIVEGILKVSIIENDIVITYQNGLWNSQDSPPRRETKLRKFVKEILAPKLEEYLSKVRVEYVSVINS